MTRFFDLIRSLMKPDGMMVMRPVIVVTAKMIPISTPENPIELKKMAQKNITPCMNILAKPLKRLICQVFFVILSIFGVAV